MDVFRTRPDSRAAPPEWFTGTVWIDEIVAAASPSQLRSFSVHFTPSARTAWHRHPRGQVIHVTEGVGRAQERGGSIQEIRAGDTVVFQPGEWHWHGAAPRTFMTHIARHEADEAGSETEWGDHVTDAEYFESTP